MNLNSACRILFSLTIFIALLFSACSMDNKAGKMSQTTELSGDYLGQPAPGTTPEIFGPGVISTQFTERDAAYSPDGKEFFYTLRGAAHPSIMQVQQINQKWSRPEVAPFSGRYSDVEPCFSLDGKRLYFVSNRPLRGQGEPKDFDIWYVEKYGNGWSEPQNLGAPVDTPKDEFYPSFTRDGAIYYTAAYEDAIGGEDIYSSQFADGRYQPPVNLGDSVNTEGGEFNSFISPDGDFIMFTSMGWGRGIGGGDLWICFRKADGSWTRARNMGAAVNSPNFEFCPSLTPDGKYLFFTSNRTQYPAYSETALSYNDIIKRLEAPGNGGHDIYWVDAKVIDELRP